MKTDQISILYMQNNEQKSDALSKLITKFCSKLYLRDSLQEGLKLYKSTNIDVVISAPTINKKSTLETLKKIREIDENQYIILTTSQENSNLLFQAIKFGVDGYIAEPIDEKYVKTLMQKVMHYIEYKKTCTKLRESEERFNQISQISQMGIFIYQEKYSYVNDAFCELIGYSAEELYEMNVWDILQEEDKAIVKNICSRRLSGEHFTKIYHDLNLVTKSGEIKIVRTTTDTIEYHGGYAGLGTAVDITDIQKTKERLNLLAQAIEQMDDMVRITDKHGKIIYVNEASTKYTKYRKSELIGKSNDMFKSDKHNSEFYENLQNTILSKQPYQGVFINSKKGGELFYEDQTIIPILDDDENIKYFVSTSKDVTPRIEMEKKLQLLAITDGLTEIYNRYKINMLIEDEFKRIKRYGGSLALIMFDIDFFKRVNDTYGHDVGDNVLITLSKIVLESIRDTDKFGRWGGEEFMILAPELNKEDAINFAQKLREKIANYHFKDAGHVTISIGVSISNQETSKEKILKDVDDSLYKAKNSGRNRVVCNSIFSGNT